MHTTHFVLRDDVYTAYSCSGNLRICVVIPLEPGSFFFSAWSNVTIFSISAGNVGQILIGLYNSRPSMRTLPVYIPSIIATMPVEILNYLLTNEASRGFTHRPKREQENFSDFTGKYFGYKPNNNIICNKTKTKKKYCKI